MVMTWGFDQQMTLTNIWGFFISKHFLILTGHQKSHPFW